MQNPSKSLTKNGQLQRALKEAAVGMLVHEATTWEQSEPLLGSVLAFSLIL